jgi:hypothetical protein
VSDYEIETKERLLAPFSSDVDPTEGDPPEFAFTQDDDRPTVWHDGSWLDTANALTPIIGGTGTGATVELEAGTWTPWMAFEFDGERPVRKLKRFKIRG